MRNGMSAARRVTIPALAATSAACRHKAGEVRLRVPKLRRQTFETAIIERYRRRESSVEEALGPRQGGGRYYAALNSYHPATASQIIDVEVGQCSITICASFLLRKVS
jgi:hypothetical protein